MIPVLYSPDETSFTSNGIGRLSDCISCVVTEERNGEYELQMEYPVDGEYWDRIKDNCVVKAKANQKSDAQLFDIYSISKNLEGSVTIRARHISYRLSQIPLFPFAKESIEASDAMSLISTNAAVKGDFRLSTNIETKTNFGNDKPCSVRSKLGGSEGSMLDTYGGEYEFDNFDVKLLSNRGEEKPYTIRYGNDLTGFEQEQDTSDLITAMIPYFKNDESLVYTNYIVYSDYKGLYAREFISCMDFTNDFESKTPTMEELEEKALSYMKKNQTGLPSVSIEVKFLPLYDTVEYGELAENSSKIGLCDTIKIAYTKLGVVGTAKIVKVEYDSLGERYNSVGLGSVKNRLRDVL